MWFFFFLKSEFSHSCCSSLFVRRNAGEAIQLLGICCLRWQVGGWVLCDKLRFSSGVQSWAYVRQRKRPLLTSLLPEAHVPDWVSSPVSALSDSYSVSVPGEIYIFFYFTTFSPKMRKAHNLCKLKIKETIETSLKLFRTAIPPSLHFTEIYVALNELSEILMGVKSQ